MSAPAVTATMLFDPAAALGGFTLVAARVVPSVVLLPAFGAPWLVLPLRVGFGLGLAGWLCMELPAPHLSSGFLFSSLWFVRELAVGCALAWLTSLVFRAVDMAGHLVDVSRRADGATLASPMEAGSTATALSALYGLFAVVLFAELGGPGHLVGALARSYEVLPLLTPALLPHDDLLWFVARVVGGTIESAVGLAAPAVVAVLLVELSIVLVGRMTSGRVGAMASVVQVASPLVGLGVVLLFLGMLRAGLEGWLAIAPTVMLRSLSLWMGR